MLHAFGHPVERCCEKLRHVGCCWLKFSNFQYPTCHDTLQQCGQMHATCCAQQCCDMLCWNVAIIWPELSNVGSTMLGYVVLICCDRLAGALRSGGFLFLSAGLFSFQVQETATEQNSMPAVKRLNVELTKEKLDTMLDGLGKIRDQLSSVSKWILTNV